MEPGQRRKILRHNLRASLLDGVFFSIMVGCGESYVAAFALAMGLGEVIAGLVTSLPQIPGALMQLMGPWAVRKLNSHRTWVVICAVLQGLSFIPLVVAALAGRISTPALFLTAAIYWGSGMATGPAWNAWMTRVFPRPIRARYFARRSRFAQLATVLALVAAGLMLHSGKVGAWESQAFALTFGVAGLCRMISGGFLAAESEPPLTPEAHQIIPHRHLVGRLHHEQGGRLIVYLVSVQASIWVAGPYFAPYMLRQLVFDYRTYMMVTACTFLAKAAMLPFFGALAHRFGTGWLMWLGGIGIIPLPALWMVSDSVGYLVVAQVLAGTMWAAHELAALLLMFETIPSTDRTSILTLYNLGNAGGLVIGSLVGGAALSYFRENHTAYMIVFGLSSSLRVLTLFFLARVKLRIAHPDVMAVRTLSVQPSEGAIDRPILPSVPDAPPSVDDRVSPS